MKSAFFVESSGTLDRLAETDAVLARHSTIHEAVLARAAAFPDHPALLWHEETISYGALVAQARAMAGFLLQNEISGESRIGLMLERGPALYAAMLAILMVGGTYVPIDPTTPPDRVRAITNHAALTAAFIESDAAAKGFEKIPCFSPDAAGHQAYTGPLPTVAAETVCYIIYTSGSTGRPKGVALEHRHVMAYLRGAQAVYGLTPDDRVYQGFSVAFDAAVEEIWLSLAVGATLVPAPSQAVRSGACLPEFCTLNRITVLSVVPTLLAMVEQDIPSLRLLILGGETCQGALVRRWLKPGRRVLNTYGPTETAVVATWSEVDGLHEPDIGFALPGYRIHLTDAAGGLVPPGHEGEICIAGPAVARGYLNDQHLTDEKFGIEPPDFPGAEAGARLYRTGDLGMLSTDGRLKFLGRRDGQVKLRGFRLELDEIEAAFTKCAAVKVAAATVQKSTDGMESLVAFIVPQYGETVDHQALLAEVARLLPPHAVPDQLHCLSVMPLLTSGKIDRKNLPSVCHPHETGTARPQTLAERIAIILARILGRPDVPLDADLFLDLGGHSLVAARLISALREDLVLPTLAIRSVYEHRTVRSLARYIETAFGAPKPNLASDDDNPVANPPLRKKLIQRAQILCLWPLGLIRLLPLLFPALVSLKSEAGTLSFPALMAAGLFGLCLSYLIAALGQRALLFGIAEGRHTLWSTVHLRVWLARQLAETVPVDILSGTPLYNFWLRLAGATIGRGAVINATALYLPSFLTIGPGATIGRDTCLSPDDMDRQGIFIGRIVVGANATLGTRTYLSPNCDIGAGAELCDLSMAPRGTTIPAGSLWRGAPARHEQAVGANIPADPPVSWLRRTTLLISHGVASLFLLTVPALPTGLGSYVLFRLAYEGMAWWPLATLGTSIATTLVLSCGFAVCLRLLPLKNGVKHPLNGFAWVRHRFADGLIIQTMTLLRPLLGTLFAPSLIRLLGGKVGAWTEIATLSFLDPRLVEIDRESFIADNALIACTRLSRGSFETNPVTIGRRTFIGNSAVVSEGSKIGNGCLLGVASVQPQAITPDQTSWLGSPALFLPKRDIRTTPDQLTYRPSFVRIVSRLLIEICRILLPTALVQMVLTLVALVAVWWNPSVITLILLAPFVFYGAELMLVLAAAAAKWLVIGRYRPCEAPLWSNLVWRSEFVTGLYEAIASPFLLRQLGGTPLLPPLLRLFGVKIGKDTVIETADMSEFDLVDIQDGALIGSDVILQTHLFEDRVMKMDRLIIGTGSAVGSRAVILYGTLLGDHSQLSPLSLLMKAEQIPPDTAWQGLPAEPINHHHHHHHR